MNKRFRFLILTLTILIIAFVFSACREEPVDGNQTSLIATESTTENSTAPSLNETPTVSEMPLENKETTGSEQEPKDENPAIIVESVDAHPGDVVKVPIQIKQSPGIAAYRIIIEFDNENLKLEAVSYGLTFSENGEELTNFESPIMLAWSQLENMKGDALLAELTFRVSEEAKVFNKIPVSVIYAPTDLINIDEIEVEFSIENGLISIVK